MSQDKSFIKNLVERRFPQIIAIYFGACWTILEFLSWVVEHFSLSKNITDFSFVTLISLLPTVGVLAYFHGKPGRDIWTKTEKITIPINLIFTSLLLFVLFSGKELGSATTQVKYKNETGQTIQREVPKKELRKRLAIFFFEHEGDNPQWDWLQYGFMFGCHIDLEQDLFFSIYSAYEDLIYQKIMQAGFGENLDMPMALEKKIAKEIQREFFLGGTYNIKNDTILVNTYLYETASGQLINEHAYRGTTLFELIDRITANVKQDLEIPKWHIKEVEDLPIKEIFTHSVSAYRNYITASNLINLKNDYRGALEPLEEAVQTDPTFTMAYWGLYAAYINTNQSGKAHQAIQKAINYIYKLPEKIQFRIKEEYYLITENPEKRASILKMMVRLYPKDIHGHFRLAEEYLKQHKLEKAIEKYKFILKLDPVRKYYLRYIGDIYKQMGKFKEALNYYNQHQNEFPRDYRSFSAIGELFITMGKYQEARQYLNNALIIDPTNISIMVRLADVDKETGDFTKALKQYEEARQLAKTAAEKVIVNQALQKYYTRRGQIRHALDHLNKQFKLQVRYMNPVDLNINQIYETPFDLYMESGQTEEALTRLERIAAQLAQPWQKLVSLGYIQIYTALQDTANLRSAMKNFEEAIRIFGQYSKRKYLYQAEAEIAEAQGNYINAIMNYQKKLNYDPNDVRIVTDIGRCYRHLGDLNKAEEFLQNTLSILPYYPQAHYQLALTYQQMGKPSLALEHLETVQFIWQNADSSYTPALNARQLFLELKKTVNSPYS